jgi:hypothetical protein
MRRVNFIHVKKILSDECVRRGGGFKTHEELAAAQEDAVSPSKLFQLFLLYVQDVATLDGSSFDMHDCESPHYIRISTVSSLETLREGIRRIDAGTKDRAGFRKFADTKSIG